MRALLPLLFSLAAPLAYGQEPADALSEGVRRVYEEGRTLDAQGRHADAAIRYRTVLKREPSWLQAVVDLGHSLEAADRPQEAVEAYQRAPFYSDAVAALARLYLRQEDWTKAQHEFGRLRNLRPGTPEFLIYEARATAATDPLAGAEIFDEFLGRPGATLWTEDGPGLAGEIAAALCHADETEACREVIDVALGRLEAEGADPMGPECAVLVGLRERLEVEAEAERLMRAADRPLTLAEQDELSSAFGWIRQGDPERARSELEDLAARLPNSASVHGALADALLALDEVVLADAQASLAERLDPLDPVHSARVGAILFDRFAGRYDRDAAAAFARALSRPTAPQELWFRKGQAELRAGLAAEAAQSMERYLESGATGEQAVIARWVVDGRDLPRAEPPTPTRVHDRLPGIDADSQRHYWIAQVLARPPRGRPEDLDQALAELEPVLAAHPDFVAGRNLEAEIRVARDERDLASALYARSLDFDPEQPEVMVVLSRLLRQQGQAGAADAWLERAADLGEPRALVGLARKDLDRMALWSAQQRLERYFASPSGAGAEVAQAAREVEDSVRRRLLGLYTALGLGVFGLIALPLGLRARSRGGAELRVLIDRSPAVWPDVARILSAIRHEVLKHHTTILEGVAHELEVGDPGVGAWAADRIGGPDGALARFAGYVRELETLGRIHGVRLNLRHRDPVFGPMIAAMEQLSALEADLRHGNPRIVTELRSVAEQLNRESYRGLGRLLRQLCLLPLDPSGIQANWERVCREAQSEVPLELDFEVERPILRIFRGELDDIFTNLLRNALEAASDGQRARVGVGVRVEFDEITGLERVAIRVRDNAERRISTAMIRGRYIGRGLGLAVDLISRNGGSIHVESEPGWAKAVTVRLPSAEAPDLEDE